VSTRSITWRVGKNDDVRDAKKGKMFWVGDLTVIAGPHFLLANRPNEIRIALSIPS
jgi:hypothetical protein